MATEADQGRPVSPEELPEPIRRYLGHLDPHRDHPAFAWFEMIVPGFVAGVLTGDGAASGVDDHVCQFHRDGYHAHIWQAGTEWLVCPWHRGRVQAVPIRVASMNAGLDELLQPPPPRRPWWRFWG